MVDPDLSCLAVPVMLWIPDKTQMLWLLETTLEIRHGYGEGAEATPSFKILSFFPSQLLFSFIPFPNIRVKQQNF